MSVIGTMIQLVAQHLSTTYGALFHGIVWTYKITCGKRSCTHSIILCHAGILSLLSSKQFIFIFILMFDSQFVEAQRKERVYLLIKFSRWWAHIKRGISLFCKCVCVCNYATVCVQCSIGFHIKCAV